MKKGKKNMEVNDVILGREEIFGANDFTIKKIPVPEWGGNVYIRNLNGKERDAFEASCITTNGTKREVNTINMRARLVARSICDAEGAALFTEADVNALGEKSAAALDRIFAAAQELSGLGAQDVENLAKNSEPDQSESSISA
jgi:hypothetical protein